MKSSRDTTPEADSQAQPTTTPYSLLGGLISSYLHTSDDDDNQSLQLEALSLDEEAERVVSSAEILKALNDADQARPRVITVTDLPRPTLNFCVLGCHGDPGQGPKEVAVRINQIAQDHPELKPDVFVILGDNFYPDGVFSPVDPRFESQFHAVFGNPDLTHIAGTPCVIVLGNHDGGRDTASYLKSFVPYHNRFLGTNPHHEQQAEKQQIAHSMMTHASDHPDLKESKAALFQQETIDYRLLPKHLMPYYFHSWIFGKVQLFGLNSNTYAKDYLQFLNHLVHDKPFEGVINQAHWFEEEARAARAAGRSIMIAQHHPLFTTGKRVYPSGWDAKHYLLPLEITQLDLILKLSPDSPTFLSDVRTIFKKTSEPSATQLTNANYNEFLTKIICHFQKISPDMITTAHDHSLYYYNNKPSRWPGPKLCQVVSGAGGNEELQSRLYFGDYRHLASFTREHGFAILSTDKMHPLRYDIHLFTLRGFHLQYTSDGPEPIRPANPDERVEKIRRIVLSACENYQIFLHTKQESAQGIFFNAIPSVKSLAKFFSYNSVHTLQDVDRMHTMINFFNQNRVLDYQDTIIFLNELMNELDNKESDHSLYLDINNALLETFGQTISLLNAGLANKKYAYE